MVHGALKTVAAAAVLLAAAMAGGCSGKKDMPAAGDAIVAAPPGTLSVFQLAGRLRMKVQHSSRASASLRNAGNSVTLFADPRGQVFVNGRPLGQTGGIVAAGDILFVPADFERQIRRRLRRPPPPKQPRPPARIRATVVIDPGHGGRDPGAIATSGLREKTVNLAVALAAAKLLERRGLDVVLTRSSDRFVELNERAAIANHRGADLFVSIHADAAPNRSAHGYTIYAARSASAASLRLAAAVERRMRSTRVHSRGIRRGDFRVLVRTSCPAVLVETGYLSHASESRRLADAGHRRRLAAAVADGVFDFLQRR